MNHFIKLSIFICGSLFLSGCFGVSTRVSAIGVRDYYGIIGNIDDQKIDLKIREYKVTEKSDRWKITWQSYTPYVDIEPGKEIGQIQGDFIGSSVTIGQKNKNERTIYQSGDAELLVNGRKIRVNYQYRFNENDKNGKVYVRGGEERKWYGYPAQALLIVSGPIDVLINIINAPFYLIFAGA